MAEFYVDIGAVGNEYEAYADVPVTWAVPQDGNGKAGPGHAAAVPVAELTFAAIPTSGTISVYGATVTLTGVLSAASTAAAATALASSINATTTALGAAVSALLLPLNRFVYARVKPSFPSIVQIMSRFAGSDLNYPANSSARAVNTFDNAAMTSPVDFTGGADGPWAYLANGASVFGKSVVGGYGTWFNAPATPANPGPTDCVHARTRRSGVNLSFSLAYSAAPTLTWASRAYLYDDGSTWAGDSGQLTAEITNSAATSATVKFVIAASGSVLHASRSPEGFRVAATCTGNVSARVVFCSLAAASKFGFTRCLFSEAAANISVGQMGLTVVDDNSSNIASAQVDLSGSTVEFNGVAKSAVALLGTASGATATGGVGHRIVVNGMRVRIVAATGAIGPVIYASGNNTQMNLQWVGGEVVDTNGVFRCVNPVSVPAVLPNFIGLIDGVAGVTDPSIRLPVRFSGASQFVWNQPEGPNKGFRFETPTYTVDWKGDGTFPYTGVAADLRGVNWSHRITWVAGLDRFFSATPVRLGYFNRAAPGVRTFTLNLYVPDASPVYKDELELHLSYLDSSDVWRTQLVAGAGRAAQGMGTRTALAASATTWVANGVANYSAAKIEVTTTHAVKSGSEVVIALAICGYRASPIVFYVSPEVVAS